MWVQRVLFRALVVISGAGVCFMILAEPPSQGFPAELLKNYISFSGSESTT